MKKAFLFTFLWTHCSDTRGTTVFGYRDPTLVPSSRESLPTSNKQSMRRNWTHAAKYTLKKDQARSPLIMEAKFEKTDQKSSVYDVAIQLKSIPAQISIWELLSTLEAHRESFS
uniref:Orf113c n=1 Tax=Batis maritima TaxID=4436 RepID=A0A068BE53_BATMA|nr:orf113c [Batis maritima]AIC83351.1 orf113c [Batis maritima]